MNRQWPNPEEQDLFLAWEKACLPFLQIILHIYLLKIESVHILGWGVAFSEKNKNK